MITIDQETARVIASRLRTRAEAFAYPAGTDALCKQLFDTVDSASFPGALIPELKADGELLVLAIASPADWRRLSPVLRAFAGPTLTSFDGLPSTEPTGDDLNAVLAGAGPAITAAIKLPADDSGRDMALRALVRVRDTLLRAPSRTRTAPEPTSWLLARFQDCLNVGRQNAASAVLEQLRNELRLDALNLRSLQVQLLATFEAWDEIVNLPGFANLIHARRTPATTAFLLEALYQARLAPSFETGDQAAVEKIYADEVRSFAAPLLKAPLPVSLRTGGWRLAGLEALNRTDLIDSVVSRSDQLGWLTSRLAATGSRVSGPNLGVFEDARDRLVAAETTESVDFMAAALEAMARLNDQQRAELARAEPFRSALRGLEQEAGCAGVPTSWPMWLAQASDPSFTNALALARLGAEEWQIAGDAADPTSTAAFLAALNAAQSNPLAAERTAQALPYLVAALRQDPLFPNPVMAPVYSSTLTLLALGSSRGNEVFDSSLILVDALLTVGTTASQYRELTADVDEIAGEGFGVRMVYWALETVEAFMRAPTPDATARERLVHSVLIRLTPIHARLSALQQAAVHALSEEFGFVVSAPPATRGVRSNETASRMRGKTIAIYSLVESASRQAKAAIQAIEGDVDVQCNSDLVGSAQLRNLATNSDLFVVVWAAAKHAATEFIRTHRNGRPLVYAEGKGVSSLLRAVDEHFNA
jgi:hypothetical protein